MLIDLTAGRPVSATIPADGVLRLLAPNLPPSGNGKVLVEVFDEEGGDPLGRIACFVEGRREAGPRRIEIEAPLACGRPCRISLPVWGQVPTAKD